MVTGVSAEVNLESSRHERTPSGLGSSLWLHLGAGYMNAYYSLCGSAITVSLTCLCFSSALISILGLAFFFEN